MGGADAVAQVVTEGEVNNWSSVFVSSVTGGVSGGTGPIIIKSGSRIAAKIFVPETVINVVDSGTKQLIDKGEIELTKTARDTFIATITGSAGNKIFGNTDEALKVFSYKYNVAKSQGFPERANYFNFRINSMVGINSLSRGSIPKVTENLIQNITDSFSSDQIQGMTEFLQNIANATTSTDLGINSDTYASNARTIVNGVTYQRVNESNYWTPIE